MQRTPSDTENKLLLLHAIDCLGAVTAEQLLLFVTEHNQMDYIALQLGLAELADAGQLRRRPHVRGALYALTGKGHDSLALFRQRVPHSRLKTVQDAAERWRQRFRREKQTAADFTRTDAGEYTVRMALLEGEETLLSMEISVPTHTNAQRMMDAWTDSAPEIYADIMRRLSQTDDPTEP